MPLALENQIADLPPWAHVVPNPKHKPMDELLNHGEGLRSFYAHLQEFAVAKGDTVAEGQSVGVSGSTGSLLGPALYFEMRHHFDVVSFAEVRP